VSFSLLLPEAIPVDRVTVFATCRNLDQRDTFAVNIDKIDRVRRTHSTARARVCLLLYDREGPSLLAC
jgi:hypothetical protein